MEWKIIIPTLQKGKGSDAGSYRPVKLFLSLNKWAAIKREGK